MISNDTEIGDLELTLNGKMTVIMRYFTEFGIFGANNVTVVEVRRMLSATKCSPKNLGFNNRAA